MFSEWNPSGADKKGIVLVVTSGKEGAISGGADFVTVGATAERATAALNDKWLGQGHLTSKNKDNRQRQRPHVSS